MTRLPPWFRRPLQTDERYGDTCGLLTELGLSTVCADAMCPNRMECWNRGTATIMILGDVCTRNCRFCAVKSGEHPAPIDAGEADRVADACARMGVRHVVLTSVTRDDLPDGGASQFAACMAAIRARLPQATMEVLTPDFRAVPQALDVVLDASPDVFNHNLETVERLQGAIRPQASYATSLDLLRRAADRAEGPWVKSGLMLGMGERDGEVLLALRDLLDAGVRLLTLGQYLAPTSRHWKVDRYVTPEAFTEWGLRAEQLGFVAVVSGPLVRSSYRADRLLEQARVATAHHGGSPDEDDEYGRG